MLHESLQDIVPTGLASAKQRVVAAFVWWLVLFVELLRVELLVCNGVGGVKMRERHACHRPPRPTTVTFHYGNFSVELHVAFNV